MRTYFFVDSDGTENVSNILPTRHEEGFWTAEVIIKNDNKKDVITDSITELPRGTINALFNVNLTFKDNPIMIEQQVLI